MLRFKAGTRVRFTAQSIAGAPYITREPGTVLADEELDNEGIWQLIEWDEPVRGEPFFSTEKPEWLEEV